MVVTTFNANVTGSYTLTVVGPGGVQFSSTTATTSTVSVATTTTEATTEGEMTEAAEVQEDTDLALDMVAKLVN